MKRSTELTERELQIAKECCKGKSSGVIASELGISQRTVENHKYAIYRKLGIKNNIELINKLYKIK
mgnify:FL=1